MKNKALIISMVLAAFTAVSLTGCGERAPETEVQTETETETETELSEIQIETQPVTEIQTESETQPVTEPPTEAPTENLDNLTPEQEVEHEQLFAEGRICYANDAVNVRETPDTSADNVLTSYEAGEEVYVIGKTPHWFKVQTGEYTGYASREFIDDPNGEEDAGVMETTVEAPEAAAPENAEEAPEVISEEAAVTAVEASEAAAPEVIPAAGSYADSFPIQVVSDANVRVSPSEKGDVFAVANSGDQLTAIGDAGDWYEVDYNGSLGYVHKNLVG